jgi:hypothetical protein
MLIKESKLRKIIRQELKNILNEQEGVDLDWTPPTRRAPPGYPEFKKMKKLELPDPRQAEAPQRVGRKPPLGYNPNSRRSINAARKSGILNLDKWKTARRTLARAQRRKGGRKAVGLASRRGLTDPTKRAAAAALSDEDLARKLAGASPPAAELSKGLGAGVASLDPIKALKGSAALTRPESGAAAVARLEKAMAGASGGEHEDPTLATSGGVDLKGRTKKPKRQVAPGKKPTGLTR